MVVEIWKFIEVVWVHAATLCSKTPCTLSISSFPLSRHLGSRLDPIDALDLDDDRTSGRAGGRLFGGAPRDHGGS